MKKIIIFLTTLLTITGVCFGVEVPETVRVKLAEGNIITLELDTYLYGVVKSEMGLKYKPDESETSIDVGIEALKAQAVASRSYAVNKIKTSGSEEYDLVSTTSNQVYKTGEVDERIKEAVDSTTGEVLTYNGEIICAYFYSASGGHTEAPENVWSSALPYLKGVEDPYEPEIANKTYWTTTYKSSEIEELIENIGEIIDIKITQRSENDRVTELTFYGTEGETTLIKNNIRLKMGTTKIRSQWFEVEYDELNDEYIFEGRGYGHGVGMSQCGAIGMAEEGYDYEEILKWYYTGVELEPKEQQIQIDEEIIFGEKEEQEERTEKTLLQNTIDFIKNYKTQ